MMSELMGLAMWIGLCQIQQIEILIAMGGVVINWDTYMFYLKPQ